ncbi:acyl-CoA carboxylase epsilon subunit [Streptomyces sp. BI20]|uniref:acyl-CoA carboxylase epsilon subunit n=1 Tax=Streptomyces sp. BI20 TaxID=3403460 RepID=UPI003C77FB53
MSPVGPPWRRARPPTGRVVAGIPGAAAPCPPATEPAGRTGAARVPVGPAPGRVRGRGRARPAVEGTTAEREAEARRAAGLAPAPPAAPDAPRTAPRVRPRPAVPDEDETPGTLLAYDIRVERGDPTAEELAALVVVLTAALRARDTEPAAPAPAPAVRRAHWDHEWRVRETHPVTSWHTRPATRPPSAPR